MMGLEEEGEGGDWGDRPCKRQGLCVTTGHRQRGRDSQDEAALLGSKSCSYGTKRLTWSKHRPLSSSWSNKEEFNSHVTPGGQNGKNNTFFLVIKAAPRHQGYVCHWIWIHLYLFQWECELSNLSGPYFLVPLHCLVSWRLCGSTPYTERMFLK